MFPQVPARLQKGRYGVLNLQVLGHQLEQASKHGVLESTLSLVCLIHSIVVSTLGHKAIICDGIDLSKDLKLDPSY